MCWDAPFNLSGSLSYTLHTTRSQNHYQAKLGRVSFGVLVFNTVLDVCTVGDRGFENHDIPRRMQQRHADDVLANRRRECRGLCHVGALLALLPSVAIHVSIYIYVCAYIYIYTYMCIHLYIHYTRESLFIYVLAKVQST